MASEWIVYGGRLSVRVPWQFQVVPNPDAAGGVEHTYTVSIDIENGRLVCTELVIAQASDGPPVNSEALRRADIVDWMADKSVRQNLVFDRTVNLSGGIELDVHTAPPTGFTNGGITDESLNQFAQHYAYLMVTGQRPSGVFLRDYAMSRPNVTRWLNAARSRNILIEEHERIEQECLDLDLASAPTARSRAPKSTKAGGRHEPGSATTTESPGKSKRTARPAPKLKQR